MNAIVASAQRLSPSEAESLWRAWSVRHESAARDKLVVSYSPMVKYLAARKVRELPSHCELDDLISCGLVALVEAVDRFDPKKGATFEQYAWTRVSGAIMDELRRQDWASRSARRLARKIERTRDSWYAAHGSYPTEAELAQKLELPVDELRDRMEELSRSDVVSLNAPARGTEEALPLEIGDTIMAAAGEHEPERATLSGERSAIMRDAVAKLSEREQKILALVHVHELQGAEIGRILGVSESRVSQILAGIRRKLHDAVNAYDSMEDLAA
jgi:RNA polymerase sigma factor for flagellar operon FliA